MKLVANTQPRPGSSDAPLSWSARI